MTPDMQAAWDAFGRLKGNRTTDAAWTDNALDLTYLLGRIQAHGKVEDTDLAIELVNEMRAALNALSDALSRVRAGAKEAA